MPFLGRLKRADGESRVWNTVLDAVLRRPLVSAIGATAILLVLASPALNMRAVLSGTDDLPRDLPVMQVYDEMEESFPGGQIPAVVTIKGEDVTSPAVVASIKDLEQRAVASGRFNAPVDVTVSEDKHVAQIAIPIKGSGTDEISNEGLADLRQTAGGADGRRRRGRLRRLRVRHDGRDQGLRRLPQGPRAAGRRVRARARVPAAARHVPLTGHPDQGDHPEPAVRRRRLRRADLGLPGRPLRGRRWTSAPTAASPRGCRSSCS